MIYMSGSAEIALMHRSQCIFLRKIVFTRFKGLLFELFGLKYGQMSCMAKNISPKSKIFQFSSVYHALCISFVVQTYLIMSLCIFIHVSSVIQVSFLYFQILFRLSFGSGADFVNFGHFCENTFVTFEKNLARRIFSNSPKL